MNPTPITNHKLATGNGRILFERLALADAFWPRLVGLLRYPVMPDHFAILFPECRAIHTFFMRFPIDVAFLSDDLRVVETYPRVAAGRLITNRNRKARHTLETAAGLLDNLQINHHEKLQIIPA